jgi:hypothetical protein
VAPSHRFLAIAAILTQSACSGQGVRVSEPAPAAPEAAVTAFLAAVNSNDVARMAQLWGTDRGPSPVVIRNTRERERRLAVMQQVLWHDAFRFVAAPSDQIAPAPGRRILTVELTRGERRVSVPFTVVGRRAGGWIVEDIGLEAAMPLGNLRRASNP